MIILFSPSEDKKFTANRSKINQDSFIFPELFPKRINIIKKYNEYVLNAKESELSKLFGIKNTQIYKKDILKEKTTKAINRYDGVAFSYLDYESLKDKEKTYINKNTIIFSNLFGPISANDDLPIYKIKQGEKLDGLSLEKYYKDNFTKALDNFLDKKEIIDLRAEFYNKFYKPKTKSIKVKFLKNSKVVNHWAKAYRGLLLRHLAINNIKNINEFKKMHIKELQLNNIKDSENKIEFIFDINN